MSRCLVAKFDVGKEQTDAKMDPDSITLILNEVYTSDIFKYNAINKEYYARYLMTWKLGQKLMERRGWHGALKHALKVKDYELFEVLIGHFSRLDYMERHRSWNDKRHFGRYVLLWDDDRAMDILMKHHIYEIIFILIHCPGWQHVEKWFEVCFKKLKSIERSAIIFCIVQCKYVKLFEFALHIQEVRETLQINMKVATHMNVFDAVAHGNPHAALKMIQIIMEHGLALYKDDKSIMLLEPLAQQPLYMRLLEKFEQSKGDA